MMEKLSILWNSIKNSSIGKKMKSAVGFSILNMAQKFCLFSRNQTDKQ